jgi:seryl-tRNA synthetase
MIELKILRNETERVIAGLKKRNISQEQLDLVQEIISLDDQRKLSQANMDQRLSQINQLSKEIGLAMKSNDLASAEKNKLEVARLKEENKEHEELLNSSLKLIEEKLIQLPNIPHVSVPAGKIRR